MSNRAIILLTLFVLFIWLIFSGFAHASTPAEDQYGNPMKESKSTYHGNSDSVLPLTGGEFSLLIGGAILLLISGIALRSASDFEK
jgi:Ca2+/Na+ antiporter